MKPSSTKVSIGGRGRAARRRLRAQLATEGRSVRRRLAAAVAPNFCGPVLGRANIVYELAGRTKAVAHGGMGMVTKLVKALGLAEELDSSLCLLAPHKPYYEPDHVLNIAYNALCGGRTLDDIELRRADQVFLDGIGAAALPDPTTAGDFCRRFGPPPGGGEPGPATGLGGPAGQLLLRGGGHRRRRHHRPHRCRGQAGHRHRLFGSAGGYVQLE